MEAEAREEEQESLQAIYGPDFEALGQQEWRVRIGFGRAWLYLALPDDYPQSAPVPRLEPAEGADFAPGVASSVAEAALEAWAPGEVCVYNCCVAAEERLRDLDAGAGEEADPAADAGAAVGRAECTVDIAANVAEEVSTSLTAAGFESYPGGLFSHLTKGITVYVGTELTVTVDGVEAEDLTDWLRLQLEDAGTFGASLALWATAQRSEEPGFAEEGGEPPAGGGLDFLPSPEDLKVDRERQLTILTWGKAFRKQMPPESQANFNAGILNGRGGGADIRVDNGLTEAVQRNVASCGLFPRWLEMVVTKIETEGLHTVSINCTKGRHRSVAAAEILKREYYPRASTVHTSPAVKR